MPPLIIIRGILAFGYLSTPIQLYTDDVDQSTETLRHSYVHLNSQRAIVRVTKFFDLEMFFFYHSRNLGATHVDMQRVRLVTNRRDPAIVGTTG